jgi:hypothetical protein
MRRLSVFLIGIMLVLFSGVSDAGVNNCHPTWKCNPTPSPTIRPTPSPTAIPTPTITPIPSPTLSPTPSPTIIPTITPTQSPSPSSMLIGVAMGQWGGVASDIRTAVNFVSVSTDGGESKFINEYVSAGLGIMQVRVGPYNSGGVAALNADAWATAAVAAYNANRSIQAIEVLNEPGGSWFWGSGALSQTNATAYDLLLRKVHDAFIANGSRPKILASYDGGYAGGSNWGTMMKSGDTNVWTYVDGAVVHPYGGTADRTQSALGSRSSVTSAHTDTGLPVWITELGWPTAVGQPSTGDSFQWTEAEQATNISNFLAWAKSTGYISAVVIFNFQDYGTNNWYGIRRLDGSHKPSFSVLH